MLNTILHGAPGAGVPLVIAHGLYGSARNWGVIAKRLSETRQVIAVDMRNHGSSPRETVQGYPEMASDLAEVIAAHGGRADLLGHSMGGKAAMVLALSQPDLIERLMVADIAPVAYTHSQIQYVEAMKAVDLSAVSRRSDADAQLAASVPEPALRAFFLQSIEIDDDGARWKLNLDVLGREMAKIVGFPDVEGQFDRPALFVTGEQSDYVSDADWPRIEALFPAAERRVVAGAGHWLHAEAPRPFLAEVEAFLEAHPV
ncbi:alpha/beta fold hydrolase [Rhodobacteraceae bacterium DSL-40]|uniref:alpha/beta fold hydrolase n=1 Tax=Amaricoccus sp. B4 TaxID=3368557 RepID=UPI000DAE55A7